MKHSVFFALSLVFVLGCGRQDGAAPAAASVQPAAAAVMPADLTLAQVLDRYAQAIGGRDRVAGIESVRMNGHMTTTKDVQGAPLTVEKKREGGKYLRRLETGGATVVQAVDGNTVWEIDPAVGGSSAHILEGVQARRYRHRTSIEGPLLDSQAKGYSVELAGKQKLDDGSEAYRLRVDYGDGDVAYFLLDAKSFLPVRVVDVILQPNGNGTLEVTTHLRDYRDAGGVKWPFEEETVLPNFNQRIVWDKVEVNVPLADSAFKLAG